MYRASNLKCIKTLDKELEELKLEKDGLDGKLACLLKSLKNLDNLIKSQRVKSDTTRSQKHTYKSPSHRSGGHRPHGAPMRPPHRSDGHIPHGASMRPSHRPAGHRPHGPSLNPMRPNMNSAIYHWAVPRTTLMTKVIETAAALGT
nr:hypothetical protein [Tanacetum cinerariifolium]